ncbi:hypothetical protein KCU77_g886, partial [Aureobasidium melanogenum]
MNMNSARVEELKAELLKLNSEVKSEEAYGHRYIEDEIEWDDEEEDVKIDLENKESLPQQLGKNLGTAKRYLEHTKEILENVSKKMEPVVTGLEKEINDSVQGSINLIKAQIEQPVKSMEELKSGEIDQRVAAIYCDGHDWLTESIARWEAENKKAEGEIRKLEWLVEN